MRHCMTSQDQFAIAGYDADSSEISDHSLGSGRPGMDPEVCVCFRSESASEYPTTLKAFHQLSSSLME